MRPRLLTPLTHPPQCFSRLHLLTRPYYLPHPLPRPLSNVPRPIQLLSSPCAHRFISSSSRPSPRGPPEPRLSIHRDPSPESSRRTNISAVGMLLGMGAIWFIATSVDLPPKPDKNDPPLSSPSSPDAFSSDASITQLSEDGVELVPTGTSSVPYFPRTLTLPARGLGDSSKTPTLPAGIGDAGETYRLLGLGIRTVSFLRIQVYVVGIYVAESDLGVLQERMIRSMAGAETASTLVAGEREELRRRLVNGEGSEEVWGELWRVGGIRSVARIVPTRGTDMGHLRDGWVRGITARSHGREGFEDEGFAGAVGKFKGVFGRARKVGKGRELLLERDGKGALRVWIEGEKLGEVEDERVSRLVWMGYLAGKNVSSEGARQSVVDGVMELVGRPVGTVETKVE